MKAIPISPVDALFANGGYPIEFLFFYPDGLESRALRTALHRLARPLWPAFGPGPPSCVLPLTVGRHSTLILSQGDRFVLRLAY